MLENVSKSNPAIVDDVIPNIISIADFQKILINLLNEGIPIRDLESILETLGDHGTSIKDTDMLTEYVRQKLKRTITRKYTDGNSIKVDEHMATNVPGLFAAGDCTGGLLQVAKAVYQGAEAGLSAVRYIRSKQAE